MAEYDFDASIQRAREFSALGFEIFYLIVHDRNIPEHARNWVKSIFNAMSKQKGIVIEAFRGSTKTTTVTQTFVAYFVGHHPHTSNLLIQVGDDIAQDNTGAIAYMIEYNPGWKAVFPNVVPDKPQGWGATGYTVKRKDVEYEKWARVVSDRKDPTFVGLGRTSRNIIGKHPTGLLVIDDIDDENTTRSDRELAKTKSILTGTIFPTRTPTTMPIVIGTPWIEGDTIGYCKETGEFETEKTPVYTDGKPTWPEAYHEGEINRQRRLAGSVEFARMFLLDLERAKGLDLKREWLHTYPFAEIGDWPVVMGVDFASTADKQKDKDRDYFAVAVGRLIPGGGFILVDGLRERISTGEALQRVRSIAGAYPRTTLIAVEKLGKGEEFYYQLLHSSALPLYPATGGGKGKGDRFERQMAPLFEFNRAFMSDAPSKFINEFIKEWIGYPLGRHDDTLDAVYYACLAAVMLGNMQMPSEKASMKSDWLIPKQRKENPVFAFKEAKQ